ncbi:general substrate transporter [Hyaloscypha variabilis]
MILFSVFIGMAGWMTGFDTAYSGTVLQMSTFQRSFGYAIKGPGGKVVAYQLTATQQSLTSISSLFTAIGCGTTGITGNYLGRRGALLVGCFFICTGCGAQLATAGNYRNYLVCKCIAAIGIGHFQVAGPTYGVECTSPQMRGALLTLFAIGLALGNVIVAAVCLSTSTFQSDWEWKMPILCQIPIAGFYAALIYFFPESPRWLMTKGKEEQARRAFGKFYAMDPHDERIEEQLSDTRMGLEFEKALSSTTSWTEIFHRSYIRRTLTALVVLVSSAICGAWFILPYGAIFLAGVGIRNPFLINVVINCCTLFGCMFGPLIVEFLGRRKSMLIGYGVMGCCMLIFSSVSTALGAENRTTKGVLVAFLCLWTFSFGGFISSSSWLSSNEVHSVRLRTYAQPFIGSVAQIMAFGASFWTPYMLNVHYGNMGSNVGYFYFGITVAIWLLVFWLAPETARLTLEQVDDIFASKIRPWHTSVRRNQRIREGKEVNLSKESRDFTIEHMREREKI